MVCLKHLANDISARLSCAGLCVVFVCFRIGTRTYSHLMTHRHHFIEKMNEMSKIDVLSPLLSIQEEKRMNNSLTDILYMLQTCINEKGKDTVVINY